MRDVFGLFGGRLFIVAVTLFSMLILRVPLAFADGSTVVIKASIMPAQTIVLDDTSKIKEIYSNCDNKCSGAKVDIRYMNRSGREISSTPDINLQYENIMKSSGISGFGLVYQNKTVHTKAKRNEGALWILRYSSALSIRH